MKKRLLVLSLVLSIFLVACGSEVKQISSDTSTRKEKTETVEVESDVEETSEVETEVDSATDEDEILWEKDVDLTENTNYSIKWTKNEYDTMFMRHTITSKDINELAFCCAYGIQTAAEYAENYEDIEVSIMGFSNNLDNPYPYLMVDSVLGVMAMEEDGTMVKELPQWFNNADITEIEPDTAEILVKRLTNLSELEKSMYLMF